MSRGLETYRAILFARIIWLWRNPRQYRAHLAMVGVVSVIALFFLVAVILPAWKRPSNRMYPSRLGYPALLHGFNQPLPVTTVLVEARTMTRTSLGEGIMMSEPILVPIVPMDRILAVHVEEGQTVKKGDLLIEIDASKEEIKERSAELAVSTAEAELARVRIGSAYVLAQERPRKDEIDYEAAHKNIDLLMQKIEMARQLEAKGIISKKDLIDAQLTLTTSTHDFQLAEFDLSMSSKGIGQSVIIASNAVDDGKNALAQRRRELEDYRVSAPIDGVVQQVLVHAGEYNQDAGRPVIVIAAGLWFEANVDQGAVYQIKNGDAAEVDLTALGSQTLPGRVTSIVPLVSYNAGGPEATRPTRALGTGAPEWPSTFRVRVEIDPQANKNSVPGMTGFARITSQRLSLAVPVGAVTSLSAGSGIVQVVEGHRHAAREVRCGATADGWIEILAGLAAGEKIISDGYQFLRPQDAIVETPPKLAATGR